MKSGIAGFGTGRRAAVAAVAIVAVLSACGTWETNPTRAPIRAVHVAVVHTGKVLLVAGSGNQAGSFAAGRFTSSVWDPVADTFETVETPWDAFCSGHAQLADGRLLVAGGTGAYESAATHNAFAGTKKAYAFDPESASYVRVADMTTARWYPTLLTMGDGSVLAVAGQGSDGLLTYTSQRFETDAWTADEQPPVRDDQAGARQLWPMYPGLHLLDDGQVFFSGAHTFGATPPPGIWDLATNRFRVVGGTLDQHHTDHAMSVLLPPAQDQKVMIIGGGNWDGSLSTSGTSVIDLKQPNPNYVAAAPLDTPKMYVSAVLLPDRTVFETGGALRYREMPDSYVQSAQIFDPAAGTWSKAASPTVPRAYHSSAVLLPDGRVATFGNNPSDRSFDRRIEIYSPPYLSRGPRPLITAAPTELNYGGQAVITTEQAAPILNVSLVRPMAVTHSVDGNQRLIDVPFATESDGSLTLSLTDNPNLAPPGWYMLFVVDETGVPSVASWVRVQ